MDDRLEVVLRDLGFNTSEFSSFFGSIPGWVKIGAGRKIQLWHTLIQITYLWWWRCLGKIRNSGARGKFRKTGCVCKLTFSSRGPYIHGPSRSGGAFRSAHWSDTFTSSGLEETMRFGDMGGILYLRRRSGWEKNLNLYAQQMIHVDSVFCSDICGFYQQAPKYKLDHRITYH